MGCVRREGRNNQNENSSEDTKRMSASTYRSPLFSSNNCADVRKGVGADVQDCWYSMPEVSTFVGAHGHMILRKRVPRKTRSRAEWVLPFGRRQWINGNSASDIQVHVVASDLIGGVASTGFFVVYQGCT